MAKKLLDQTCTELVERVSDAIRLKHYSLRTEETYLDWVRRYILFHDKRHPAEMGTPKTASSELAEGSRHSSSI